MGENFFQILIEAILDKNASAKNIKQEVDRLSKEAGTLKLGASLDKGEIQRLKSEIARIQEELRVGDLTGSLTTKQRNALLKELNTTQRTLNAESRAYNQQQNADLANQRNALHQIAAAQKDVVAIKRGQSQLAKMESAETEKVNSKIREQKSLLSSMKTWRSKQTDSTMGKTGLFGAEAGDIRTAQTAYEQLFSSIKKGKISVADAKLQFQLLKDELIQAGDLSSQVKSIQFSIDTEKYSKDIKTVSDELAKVGKFTLSDTTNADIFGKAQKSAKNLETAYSQLKTTMSDAGATDQQKIEAEKKYQQELLTTKNLLSQINLSKDDEKVLIGDEKRVNMINTLNNYLAKNTAMTQTSKNKILEWIKTLASSDDLTVGSIKNINTQFKTLDATLRQTGQLGLSWTDKFKQAWTKFGGWGIATGTFMKLKTEVTDGIKFIKQMDDALTDVAYTSNISKAGLEELGNSSIQMAKDLNVSADKVLDAVKIYSTANATAEDIMRKSKPAIMLSNVSGMSGADSAKMINTAINQFDIEDTEEGLLDVVDTLEYVAGQLNYDFTKHFGA